MKKYLISKERLEELLIASHEAYYIWTVRKFGEEIASRMGVCKDMSKEELEEALEEFEEYKGEPTVGFQKYRP